MKSADPSDQLSPHLSPQIQPEDVFLNSWEREIDRAVRFRVWANRSPDYDADDLKQEARLRILQVFHNWPDPPERYIRKVIRNAILTAIRAESRNFPQWASNAILLDSSEQASKVLENALRQGGHSEFEIEDRIAIHMWLRRLSGSLAKVFDLIYCRGHTQHEAAKIMSLSQPRIAQLEEILIKRARRECSFVRPN